ncbi:hypothetical protein [Pelagicoccus mobilis]|uniref:Type II secretion system protein GspG C-terminal domain-containing protein n=1 Tax=Pelagicoccus mobilis TaxID=415221 RepID=A0A934RZ72_9BACT|nr:hypothetical protein [Pelagicoccus mobilis]MBK1876534.1 hypothetical protein [Pelagicoccus mobilis]
MPSRANSQSHFPRTAFTLFELILVMGVLGLLVGSSLVIFLGGRSEVKKDRAKADMQVIQQGLEAYRARFGDYPKIPSNYSGLGVVDTPEEFLLNALFGKIGPVYDVVAGIPVMVNSSILEYANQALPYIDEAVPANSLKSNWFIDPWGNAYEYDYRPSDNDWLVFGYTLRSYGENGVRDANGDDIVAE